ncbi:hypothetical protein F0259_14750 [Vibrio cyclitrophicus]|uniref:hypothetical protein n=1 Tax=Vibrio cyclitrophicus TaxID=47951 RepID=UPI00148DF159|nr:hypothetical protein [Vibrio cyclitrophicus]NOH45056.1 hypothetical protein [Vibrio cyclitrophicus]
MTVYKEKLKCGAEVIWSVPLSGFAHVADEQPLPYIHCNGVELTPRFGGEEALTASSVESLPLPYGKLKKNWPIKQRLFNLTRKKINIYWRNIFATFCRNDKIFYFLEQQKFTGNKGGFVGVSPLLVFSREFKFADNRIIVNDKITFLKNIEFEYFHISPYAELSTSFCEIKANQDINNEKQISSSTGKAVWKSKLLNNVKFNAGEEITWQYLYQIKS